MSSRKAVLRRIAVYLEGTGKRVRHYLMAAPVSPWPGFPHGCASVPMYAPEQVSTQSVMSHFRAMVYPPPFSTLRCPHPHPHCRPPTPPGRRTCRDGNTSLPVVSAAYRSYHTRPCQSLRISLLLGLGFTRIQGATPQGARQPFYRDRNQCMTRLPGRPPAQPPSRSMSTDRNAH